MRFRSTDDNSFENEYKITFLYRDRQNHGDSGKNPLWKCALYIQLIHIDCWVVGVSKTFQISNYNKRVLNFNSAMISRSPDPDIGSVRGNINQILINAS